MSGIAPAALISPLPYKDSQRILKIVHKGLKITLTACSILSLIPPLRLAGNLATRGIALISSGVNGAETWENDHCLEKIVQCSKIALVLLGIVAVAVSLPILSVASIAADLAYNIFEVGRAVYHKDTNKALTHLAAIAIDTFALAALATGSWELMVVAASLSAAVMLVFGIKTAIDASKSQKPLDSIDAVCHFLQAGVGVASAVMMSKVESMRSSGQPIRYMIKNPYDKVIHVYTEDGKYMMTVEPGKTVEFEYPHYKVFSLNVECSDPSYPSLSIHSVLKAIKPPKIEVSDFNKAPIDSTVYPLFKKPAQNQKVNPHLAEIEAFSNPFLADPISCAMQAEGEHVCINFPHFGPKKFHYDSLNQQIPTLKLFMTLMSDNEKKCDFTNLFKEQLIDKELEEIFIHYLTYGDVKYLDNLNEVRILQLFNLANFLSIKRLIDLTLKSIADRLKAREWKKIDLLKEIKETGQLSPLQTLLNFYSF